MRLTERKYGEIVSSKKEQGQIHCSNFCNNCSQGTGNCGYVKEMVEKLAEYEDAEEQGLLLKLPCPIGSEVWRIVNQRDNFTDRTYKIVFRTTFRLDMINMIGKTVFLTREEAEKALADMGV